MPSTTWMRGTMNGRPVVTPANALQFTPVYRAVTMIASDIARVDFDTTSSQIDSLLRSPSTLMTAFDWRRAMTMNVLLYGNAFSVLNRTGLGEVVELIMLDPEKVQLVTQTATPFYRTQQYGDIQLSEMFHLRAPSTNGLWGDSPIGMCRTSIELLGATELMALKAYENAGNPKVALVHPGKLSAEAMQAIERDYMEKHSGSLNSGRPLVAMDGLRIERLSSTLDDTGMDAARRFSIGDVARIYGVPPHLLGESLNDARGAQMEAQGRAYIDGCLMSWLRAWDSQIIAKLGNIGDAIAWDVDEWMRPGIAEQFAALRTGVESGVITRNEAREKLDYAPLPGLDDPIVAKNMGTGGGSTNLGTDTSAQGGTP